MVSSVGGTPAYAAVEPEGEDAQPLLARLAAVADGTGAAMAGIARGVTTTDRSRSSRGSGAPRRTKASPTSASRPTARSRSCPRATTTVWSGPSRPSARASSAALPDAAFLAQLAHALRARTGGFVQVSDGATFPLVLEFAREPAGTRTIALGNAAQTLHPVAGQGFNVGLRDAWELADVVLDTPREQLGDRAMVARYLRGRRADRMAGIAFTHGLVGVFGNDLPLLPLAARVGAHSARRGSAGEARVHPRDAVRLALAASRGAVAAACGSDA